MVKSWQKNTFLIMALAFFAAIPLLSFGQVTVIPCDAPNSGTICNPIKAKSLSELIEVVLEGVIKIAIPVIALAVIYSGFLFVFARGNPEKIGTAKSTLLYTIIGAAILLGAWAIAKLISETVLSL